MAPVWVEVTIATATERLPDEEIADLRRKLEVRGAEPFVEWCAE